MKFLVFVASVLLIAGCAASSGPTATSGQSEAPAGIDGKWAGTFEGGMGGQPMELDYEFKADGDVLTGTTVGAGPNARIEIQNGKIDGNKISFDVPVDMGGMKMTIAYTGELSGDELKLSFTPKMEGGPGGGPGGPGGGMPPSSFVAKRVQ